MQHRRWQRVRFQRYVGAQVPRQQQFMQQLSCMDGCINRATSGMHRWHVAKRMFSQRNVKKEEACAPSFFGLTTL
jgi:hypothetical protein